MSNLSFTYNATAIHNAFKGGNQSYCSLSPFQYSVYPIDSDTSKCPSANSILTTFGVVNLAVTTFSLLLGNRVITHWYTCGYCGQEKKNNFGRKHLGIPVPSSILYMWLVPIALQFSANAINAALMKSTPNFKEGFSIGQIMVLYLVRPRVTWLLGIIIVKCSPAAVVNGDGDGETSALSDTPSGFNLREDWRPWAYQQMFAEWVLQVITSSIGLLMQSCMPISQPGSEEVSLQGLNLVIPNLVLCFGIAAGSGAMFYVRRGGKFDREYKQGGSSRSWRFQIPFVLTLAVAALLWASRWMFWVNYLQNFDVYGQVLSKYRT